MSIVHKLTDMFYSYNKPVEASKAEDKSPADNKDETSLELEIVSEVHSLVSEIYASPWDPSILDIKENDSKEILEQKQDFAKRYFYKINLICSFLAGRLQDDILLSDFGKKFADVKIDKGVKVKVPAHLTPLSVIAGHGNVLVNQLLLKVLSQAQAQNKLTDLNLDTGLPIFAATKADNRVAVIALVIFGADVNIQDEHGYTPLHYACVNKNEDLVRCLILCEADASMVDDAVKADLTECITSAENELAEDKAHYNLNTRDIGWLAMGDSSPKPRPG